VTRQKYEIHASDMASFKRCRVLWNYTSPLRRHLEVAFPPVFFFLGSGVHAALAAYYERGVDPVTAFKLWYWWRKQRYASSGHGLSTEQSLKYAEQAKLGIGMLKHYASVYPLEKEVFELVLAESFFSVPIRSLGGRRSAHYYAAGTFDGVVVDRNGHYWLLEHKTYKQVRGEGQFDLSDQAKMYIYAAQEQFGLPVQGVVYNILRKKIPSRPMELQRGGLSRSKGIDTTYEVYLDEVKRLGYAPSDYADILGRLQERGNTFFYRFQIRKSPKEMKLFQKLLYITAREMCRPNLILYPCNDDWQCRNCWFSEPCVMEQAGHRSMAEDWLDLNTHQRSYRADRVDFDFAVARRAYQIVKEMNAPPYAPPNAQPQTSFKLVIKPPKEA